MTLLSDPEAASLEIAVIGIAGRFPGANNLDVFWQNLRNGVESVRFFSDEDLRAAGIDASLLSNPRYVKAAALLNDVELFDARFFGLSPREAEILDPQHRLFLECAWEAIESAGYDSETFRGKIGVYAGASRNSYAASLLSNQDLAELAADFHVMLGNEGDYLPTRVSYKLNLCGPSLNVQSASSTSLVAVHLACQGLLSGDCDMALAGAVRIRFPQQFGYLYEEGMIYSPDGHCRAFDVNAGGTVGGDGVGIVVLKRLADAQRDGDHIHAVILGSAINNDGSLKIGYTAPSVDGQANVIRAAHVMAGVEPETISYIEAHGTGTELGDPVEIAALTKAFRAGTQKKGFCAIGSVKTNIGHLNTAAGMTGLLKTILALSHEEMPPSLHFELPNPKCDLANSPFYVNSKLSEWRRGKTPRRAGVSSFGMGGTNAHLVLQEAPRPRPSDPARPWQLLVLSAKSTNALDAAAQNLAKHLRRHPELNLADVSYTLQVGRRAFSHRRVLLAHSRDDAVTGLELLHPARLLTSVQGKNDPAVVFMFPGQGAQYVNMGLDLYQSESVFRELVDLSSESLRPHLGVDLREILYPAREEIEKRSLQLTNTSIAQPALFVIEYALAKLMMTWGVKPRAMVGHSIGEYVAACLAGIFSLEDALKLIGARGRLVSELPSGSMLAVPLPASQIESFLDKSLSLAAINGSSLCVVSGAADAIASLKQVLSGIGVDTHYLHTSHAFHSEMMDPVLEPLTEEVSRIKLNVPQIPYLSNVTGTWISTTEATDPGYWARHVRQTVRFADNIDVLTQEPGRLFLEVGPGLTLSSLVAQRSGHAERQTVLSLLRHPRQQQSDCAVILNSLGKLWLGGVSIDWYGYYRNEWRQRVLLPTYPFERERYGIGSRQKQLLGKPTGISADEKIEIDAWFHIPSWKRSTLLQKVNLAALRRQKLFWLVFTDDCGLGTHVLRRLKASGQDALAVTVGDRFTKVSSSLYAINPLRRSDYDDLLAELRAQYKTPARIIHLWSITQAGSGEVNLASTRSAQDLGLHSLISLAQALGKHYSDEKCQIEIVSNNMQEVIGGELFCPEKATLLGPCLVIPREYPNIGCHSVDIVFRDFTSDSQERLVDNLLAEFAAPSFGELVAYRGTRRFTRFFEPMRLGKSATIESRLREHGVYLITGGLGGIGLVLAEHLAKTVRAKLVLVGRSAFPDRNTWAQWLATHPDDDPRSHTIRRLREFETFGAEVLVLSADVADMTQMQEVIAKAKLRFGRIHGLIHSAGLPDGALIQGRTRAATEGVLAAKLTGTLVLDQVLKDLYLDFFFLCSSIASILAPHGQVAYCAANAFLDAFAHYKSSQGGTCISINWDAWQEVGMSVKARTSLGQNPAVARARNVSHPLFDHQLSNGAGQEIFVSTFSGASHWILNEHRISAAAIVPGTAYLEMVRAAFEQHMSSGAMEVLEAYFVAPLTVRDGEEIEVRTILTEQDDAFEFSILSQAKTIENTWQEHAKGKIASLRGESFQRHDIKELEGRCTKHEHTINRAEHRPQGRVTTWGPRWNNLKALRIGDGEAFAALELPAEFATDLISYKLHPAILDVATGFPLLDIAADFSLKNLKPDDRFLPFSYKNVAIRHPLPPTVFSHIRFLDCSHGVHDTLKFQVIVLDEDGLELVRIGEYTLRKVGNDIVRTQPISKARTFSEFKESHVIDTFRETRPSDGIKPSEGTDIFDRVVGGELPQVVVSTRDLRLRIERSYGFSADKTVHEDELEATKHPRPELQSTYVAPRNETENRLTGVWETLLGVERVGIDDDFFELGGDSLLATQFVARVERIFDLKLPIGSLFERPTIAKLAEQVDTIRWAKQGRSSSVGTTMTKREQIIL